MASVALQPFVRYRFAWLAYAMMFIFAYLQVLISPIMPFLRAELGLSYTVGGLHATMFAAGGVLASLISPLLIDRFGRRAVIWWGIVSMLAGGGLLAVAPVVVLTLGSVLLMAIGGVCAMVIVTAGLSDLYGEQRTIALAEANVLAMVGATLIPLLVGWLEAAGIGWRASLLLPAVLLLAMLRLAVHDPVPESRPPAATDPHPTAPVRLPLAFWLFWIVLAFSIAIEWSIGLWAADMLIATRGVAPEVAALLVSSYYGAMMLGRIVGSILARYTTSERVLLLSMLAALIGVPIFWLVPGLVPGLIGLAIAGLGIGNFFPMALSATIGTAPSAINVATSRALLAGGVAMLFAPFMMGVLADRIGLQMAFATVPVLLLLMLAVLLLARQRTHRRAPTYSARSV